MSGRDEEIRRLMARGLDAYGLGQVREAVQSWRRVLALDPTHAEARDYLQAAGGDADGAPARAPEDADLLADAVALLRRGDLAEGVDLLETLAARDASRLDVQAHLELGRAALLPVCRARVGPGRRVPRVRIPNEQVLRYNLPASVGFLLSLIDGRTSVDELLALSGMDPLDVLRGLASLLDAGIVEAAG